MHAEPQYRIIADKDSTPDLVSANAAPGDRLVYEVIDDDRWSLIRIERPVEGTDPTMQVQPTPTAVLAGGIGYPVQEAARREDEHARRAAIAEPPSIADMAPGTTFTAPHPESGYRSWTVVEDGAHGWWAVDIKRNGVPLLRFDPSTIRDVSPPSTTQEP